MKNLNIKAFAGLVFLILVMAALLFFPAGTTDFWQAWVFLAMFGGASLAVTLYLMKKDPKLLERRVYAGPTAEKEMSQKIIQTLTSLGFILMLAVPGFDHRFQWSAVPPFASIAGDIFVDAGFLIIFFVYRENTFTSATIEVYDGQKVISTGLYSVVRHPMYMGALILFIGMILALASWWDFLIFLFIMPALIWRLFDEERLLTKDLPGYTDYKRKVKYRLIPYVW